MHRYCIQKRNTATSSDINLTKSKKITNFLLLVVCVCSLWLLSCLSIVCVCARSLLIVILSILRLHLHLFYLYLYMFCICIYLSVSVLYLHLFWICIYICICICICSSISLSITISVSIFLYLCLYFFLCIFSCTYSVSVTDECLWDVCMCVWCVHMCVRCVNMCVMSFIFIHQRGFSLHLLNNAKNFIWERQRDSLQKSLIELSKGRNYQLTQNSIQHCKETFYPCITISIYGDICFKIALNLYF